MRRPDELPDPALTNTDVDVAANEIVGRMGSQGDAQTMPASYGPPQDDSDDHNSQGIWESYGSS